MVAVTSSFASVFISALHIRFPRFFFAISLSVFREGICSANLSQIKCTDLKAVPSGRPCLGWLHENRGGRNNACQTRRLDRTWKPLAVKQFLLLSMHGGAPAWLLLQLHVLKDTAKTKGHYSFGKRKREEEKSVR
jgi:hypothetical protein